MQQKPYPLCLGAAFHIGHRTNLLPKILSLTCAKLIGIFKLENVAIWSECERHKPAQLL
jgi:hypothetical protein